MGNRKWIFKKKLIAFVYFFLYFCRTLSQSGQGQVRSPADGIPKGNVSCVAFIISQFSLTRLLISWLDAAISVCRRHVMWTKEEIRLTACSSQAEAVFSVTPRREKKCFWLAAPPVNPQFSSSLTAADVSSVWMCVSLPRVGRACRSSILPFLFTLRVRVLWLLLVLWRRVASSLRLFCYCFFICLSSACMHSPSDLVFSGLLQPENIVLTLQVKLCTLDLRRHSLPCSHRISN